MTDVKPPFEPRIEFVNDTPVLIQDEQGHYESLEKYLNKPTRTRLNETLTVFKSFLEAIKSRFNKDEATIYARNEPHAKYNNFTFEGVAHDCRTGDQWRDDFKINWKGVFTVSARDWLMNDEKPLPQEEFALFLDKHMADIVSPDGKDDKFAGLPTKAELYNFVTSLEDSKNQKFARKVNVQNGDVSVSLERVSDDGTVQRLKLFERFAINLQLYEGFPAWRVMAKLRYRVANGSIVFFYDIEGLEELFIENRDWATAKIKETGLPVFI